MFIMSEFGECEWKCVYWGGLGGMKSSELKLS